VTADHVQVAIGLGIVRIELRRPLEAGTRLRPPLLTQPVHALVIGVLRLLELRADLPQRVLRAPTVGPLLECRLKQCGRLGDLALPRQGQSQVGLNLYVSRLELQGFSKLGRSRRQLALPRGDDSPVVEHIGIGRPQAQRPLQAVRNRREIASGLAENAEEAPALGISRLLLDEPPIDLLGLGEIAGLMKAPAGREEVRCH
jgi:hypothetical protein